MEDKNKTPPMQVPSEANDFKHIDTPEEKNTSDADVSQKEKSAATKQLKNKAGKNSNDFSADVLQTEYFTDPGNEHHHHVDDDTKRTDSNNDKKLGSTDADDDGAGTAGS